jgi:hypothetical protein
MESSDSYLSKPDLLAAFRELDQRLSKDKTTADLFIFGGAALVLGYEARPGTRDVDAIWRPHGAVLKHAWDIGAERGWPKSWLNDQATAYLPSGFEPVGKVVYAGDAIRIMRAEPELLLAMKVAALRRRDEPDILFLAKHLGISNASEIVELTERVLGQPLIDRKRSLVEDLFPISSADS